MEKDKISMFNLKNFMAIISTSMPFLLNMDKNVPGLGKLAERKEVLSSTDCSIENWNRTPGLWVRGTPVYVHKLLLQLQLFRFFSTLGQSPNQHHHGSRCFHALDHFSEQIILATNQSGKDGSNESNSLDGCFLLYLTFTFTI